LELHSVTSVELEQKIEKTEEISGVGKLGYAVCPKCGHKEKWMYGHP